MVYKTCLIRYGWDILDDFNDDVDKNYDAICKNIPDGFEVKWDEYDPYLVFKGIEAGLSLEQATEVVSQCNVDEAEDWLRTVRDNNEDIESPTFICIMRYD